MTGFVLALLLGIIFLTVQGTLLTKWSWNGYFLDLVSLYIIYIGLTFPLKRSIVIALMAGFLLDLESGSPMGLSAGIFLVLVLAGHIIKINSMMGGSWFYMGVILVLTLLEGILYIAGGVYFRNLEWESGVWIRMIIQAVFMALIGPLLFWGFDTLIRRFEKVGGRSGLRL